ncbi:MAG: PLP-dependent transferase, partial [Bacteroidetes bacterium]|nr:PLP-dependent transferase [Bacteroidota bacterium]
EPAGRLMRSLKLITPAVSLGSVDTLIQHPAGLTQRVVSEEARAAGGVSAGLLRVSVGLEAPDDLWADLEQALG